MQRHKKLYGLSVLLAVGVGGLSGFLSRNGMKEYASLKRPPLSPPGAVFPVVWTILYILMGIASYLVLTSAKPNRSRSALLVYGVQLFFNFFWPILFFSLKLYLSAFFWLVLLWLLILVTTVLFYKIAKPAGLLLVPYLLWVAFAGYLNLGIYLLN